MSFHVFQIIVVQFCRHQTLALCAHVFLAQWNHRFLIPSHLKFCGGDLQRLISSQTFRLATWAGASLIAIRANLRNLSILAHWQMRLGSWSGPLRVTLEIMVHLPLGEFLSLAAAHSYPFLRGKYFVAQNYAELFCNRGFFSVEVLRKRWTKSSATLAGPTALI